MKKLFTLILTVLICVTACFSLTACGKDLVETDDQLAALTEVKSGASDIAVIDSVMAGYYVNSEAFKDLMILDGEEFTFANEFYAIGARKGGNTDEYINFALYELQENGKLLEIATKYGLQDVLAEIEEPTGEHVMPADDSDFGKILNKGELVLGYTLFEPIAYMDGDKLIGFDIEVAEAVCELYEITLKNVKINWDTKEDELNNGNIDVIWNGFTYTDERAENIDFTSFYLSNRQAIVIRKADAEKYGTYAGMKKAKFVAESESAGETTIRDIILPKVKEAK